PSTCSVAAACGSHDPPRRSHPAHSSAIWRPSMTTETPTIDQLLELAHKLPRLQRAELISRLALELATDVPPARPPMTPDQARAALAEIRAAIGALPQPRLTAGEQLEADRRARDRALLGRWADQHEDDDVHP